MLLWVWTLRFISIYLLVKHTFCVLCCLSYFSAAVTKYHGQGNLANIAFSWGYGFRGLKSIIAGQRHGVGACVLFFKQRTERTHWEP